ncbi:MAG: tRNA (adenosine(37)-N6)-threonylcarbamoyltransferase complex transferase subunit TsaD [Synergistaceae bacterium]|jgi:N6-L-threonylcarbamoyladenine synthase|nr:tRNA (adenosine(37)-N6)-threonylcarbamoyltransferase complex transferase subunit TsaD [Synergistaceae bacterium]
MGCFPTLTLGIETSCDDTAAAVLSGRTVLSEAISGQSHASFGGVVPEFAARAHQENILPIIDRVLSLAEASGRGLGRRQLGLIAVTRGPGLMGSLLVGVETARALSLAWRVPAVGVNHIEGHIMAPLLDSDVAPPFLSLVVSGGHTEIIRVDDVGRYSLLGATRDDAAGEAYDKAARIMGLPYPGGPEIDRLARAGDPRAFDFPVPFKNTRAVEFSFSGLKTALLQQVSGMHGDLPLADLCASFQRAVTDALVSKTELAVRQTGITTVCVSGGVAANSALRSAIASAAPRVVLPAPSRCTDNAAMVALAGYERAVRGLELPPLVPDPSLSLCGRAI